MHGFWRAAGLAAGAESALAIKIVALNYAGIGANAWLGA
jgi:hypothetical protein